MLRGRAARRTRRRRADRRLGLAPVRGQRRCRCSRCPRSPQRDPIPARPAPPERLPNGVHAPKARPLSDLREAWAARAARGAGGADPLGRWATRRCRRSSSSTRTTSSGSAPGLPSGWPDSACSRARACSSQGGPPERVYPLLLLGAALLGGGLVTAALGSSVAARAPVRRRRRREGLVTALGFPYFARFIPEGGSGRYSGLYFSVRAIASAVALPLAGVAIELSGSYRSLLVIGAAAGGARAAGAAPGARALAGARRPAPARRWRPSIPCHGTSASTRWSRRCAHVDEVVLVDDGCRQRWRARLDRSSSAPSAPGAALASNSGKGDAVAAGAALLVEAERPDAILVLDADGQHPPERDSATSWRRRSDAHVVVGDRSGRPQLDAAHAALHERGLERAARPRAGAGWPTPSAACGSTAPMRSSACPSRPGATRRRRCI